MLVLEKSDGKEVPIKVHLRECRLKCILNETEEKFDRYEHVPNLELDVDDNGQVFIRSALNPYMKNSSSLIERCASSGSTVNSFESNHGSGINEESEDYNGSVGEQLYDGTEDSTRQNMDIESNSSGDPGNQKEMDQDREIELSSDESSETLHILQNCVEVNIIEENGRIKKNGNLSKNVKVKLTKSVKASNSELRQMMWMTNKSTIIKVYNSFLNSDRKVLQTKIQDLNHATRFWTAIKLFEDIDANIFKKYKKAQVCKLLGVNRTSLINFQTRNKGKNCADFRYLSPIECEYKKHLSFFARFASNLDYLVEHRCFSKQKLQEELKKIGRLYNWN